MLKTATPANALKQLQHHAVGYCNPGLAVRRAVRMQVSALRKQCQFRQGVRCAARPPIALRHQGIDIADQINTAVAQSLVHLAAAIKGTYLHRYTQLALQRRYIVSHKTFQTLTLHEDTKRRQRIVENTNYQQLLVRKPLPLWLGQLDP